MSTVSVTIPCRNEEKYIAKCLQSIIDCDYEKSKITVFVCDGLSDDRTQAIINEFSEKYPFIQLLVNHKKTTPQALNLGLKANDAAVKIILGAHAEIYHDYIKNCVEILNTKAEVGCVGGILENVMEDETSTIISLAMSSSFGVGNAHFRTGEKDGYVDTVAFGAYKNEVFTKAGYFDEDLIRNQDDEFNYRLQTSGYKIFLSKNIKSKYYVRASYQKLYKQYYQYGYWKVFVNTKHKTVTTIRQTIPALFVMFIFFGSWLSLLSHFFFSIFLAGLFAYLAIGLYSANKKSANALATIKIFYVFFILHFSYGLGYLKGIIDFVVMGRRPSKKSEALTR